MKTFLHILLNSWLYILFALITALLYRHFMIKAWMNLKKEVREAAKEKEKEAERLLESSQVAKL